MRRDQAPTENSAVTSRPPSAGGFVGEARVNPEDRAGVTPRADDDAVRSVYDASYPRLLTHVLALCGNLAEAEDIVQEAFVRAMTQRHDFADAATKEAWLRVTAVALLRKSWRRRRIVGRFIPRMRRELSLDLGPDTPDNQLAVVFALSQLGLPVSETVVLHYVAHLDVGQIARELGVPEGTVAARLARARTQMSGHLVDPEEVDHV